MKMFRVTIKNSTVASISFKLLIIMYLLIVGTYFMTTPTVAYFTEEQTVEATLVMAEEFNRDESESTSNNDNTDEDIQEDDSAKETPVVEAGENAESDLEEDKEITDTIEDNETTNDNDTTEEIEDNTVEQKEDE